MVCACTSGAEAGSASQVDDRGDPTERPDIELVRELAIANRILFQQGVLDAFGHVSVRHDKRPDRFLLARNMAPALVTEGDIVEFDLAGNPVDAAGRPVYLERFIHSEVYKARPDVIAVVHSHSPSVVPFGVVKSVPFRAVCHMSGFIGDSTPIFEIREVCGDGSDLLVRNGQQGAALATTLGSRNVVLMRGHGSTVVGSTLRQAVFRAVYTETNAKLQSEALRLGTVTYLSAAEGEATDVSVSSQIDRAWNLWREEAVATWRASAALASAEACSTG
ncbi:class II aldolase/adducin family protein [Rhizobium sp. P28RR-XV]|uniref:class II aldolase/adducin family protein n=1 Tax=Rhizobium sp. P28RR-XV TaxID=2726737 RepID=UPI0014567FB5|nr:class II aldolase/adducin family protein [Rhizobium sp. P28RR-XV]NLR88206.1 class II aldolase/adducin family protein [Rhizobium sp. P28RR-XV]